MSDDKARRTPNSMAADMAATLADLLARRDAATDKRERKQLSSRIRAARTVIAWAKSRAGYAR